MCAIIMSSSMKSVPNIINNTEWRVFLLVWANAGTFSISGGWHPECASVCRLLWQLVWGMQGWFHLLYEDWEVAIGAANGMPNSCPEGSQCRTFGELFGNGQGLCNRLWGPSWNYSTDTDNCTVMAFDNSMANPNYRLTFPRSGSLSTVILGSTVMQVLAILLMYLVLTVAAINASYWILYCM